MFESLRSRLWLTYTLLVALILCVVGAGFLLYLINNPLIDRQALLNLQRIADIVATRQELLTLLQQQPRVVLRQLEENSEVRAILLDNANQILLDSHQDAETFGPLGRNAMGRKERGVTVDRAGQSWLYIARSLSGNRIVFLVPRQGGLALLQAERLRNIFRDDLLPPLLQTGGLALLLALGLAFWIARWVAAPLQRIAAASRQLAQGKFQVIPPDGPTEVRQMALAFNEMSHRVQATQQSQRDFIVNVSHELKTPLTSVQGFAQAILDGAVASQSDLEHAAGVIRNEAERMNRLVLDLLELARFEAGTVKLNIQSIEAGELLRSVAQRFSLAASQAQVKLELDVQQPITFLGDGDRLGQVLNNLVDNAIKYSPSGGRIILQAKQVDGKINLAVKDNGPGIPDEESSRIFERFYQIDRARRGGRERGVGLGLAIAREIVQAHGGFIHVEKNPPQGSSFVVNLQSAHL